MRCELTKGQEILCPPYVEGKRFGVEIEVEFPDTEYIEFQNWFWNSVYDGSLRGKHREFKPRQPTPYKEMANQLVALFGLLKYVSPKFRISERCGLHIHISDNEMCDLLRREDGSYGMTRAFIFCKIMEKLIIKEMNIKPTAWEKETLKRYENNSYCRPLEYSDVFNERYTAVNTCSLRKYGSVEVRVFAGTRNSVHVIKAMKIVSNSFEKAKKICERLDFNKEYEKIKKKRCKKEKGACVEDMLSYAKMSTWHLLYVSSVFKSFCEGKDIQSLEYGL